jgi:hypothetical protein
MVTSERKEWVLLSYRLPREPSTPRIAHWRALRRLGAARVHDGLAALPATVETREQLEWLADAVIEADGSANVWLARLTSQADEQALVEQMQADVEAEYRELAADAGTAPGEPEPDRRRTIGRLRRRLRQVRSRDYFGAPGRDAAERAVQELGRRAEAAA